MAEAKQKDQKNNNNAENSTGNPLFNFIEGIKNTIDNMKHFISNLMQNTGQMSEEEMQAEMDQNFGLTNQQVAYVKLRMFNTYMNINSTGELVAFSSYLGFTGMVAPNFVAAVPFGLASAGTKYLNSYINNGDYLSTGISLGVTAISLYTNSPIIKYGLGLSNTGVGIGLTSFGAAKSEWEKAQEISNSY